VLRAFRSALETLTGKTPSNAQLSVLVAQSALETGRWRSIHCWNFGNVKAGPDYEWLYCQFRCNEVIAGKVEWFDPPHPQCNFRAFTNIDTGALAHLRFLSGLKRYAGAWKAAEQGDPAAFVHALKLAGYFTADETPYRRAVVPLFNEYMRMLASEPSDTEPSPPPDEHELHQAALAALATSDPLEAARDERREAMEEP
jgi:flagellum-specific peptidoglycan hydrolase FlgJ